jgi:gluconolactonase
VYRFMIGASLLVACSAGDTDDSEIPNYSGPFSPSPSAAAGAPGAVVPSAVVPGGSGTTGGAGGSSPVTGGAGAGAGSPVSSAGAPGLGAGGGGVSEGGAGGAPLDPGAGGAGTPAGGGAGGVAGQPPPGDGPFVSVPVNGGASAAFVCPQGVAFGDPLAGMGAVQNLNAPQGDFFAFIEGPVWVGSLNRLFFSDNASSPERIWQLDPPFTTPSVFLPNSGSNGLALDNQDRLLLANEVANLISLVDPISAQVIREVVPAGDPTPNDLIMRSDDNLYFTAPNSEGTGFYRVSPAGEVSGPFTGNNAANAPNAPNGVVLSPDENTLYVGDVNQSFVSSFALLVDGSVDTTSGEVFVNTQSGTVDGMAVDCAGNLYVGTSNGVEVYAPDARLIGVIPTGVASNATFGGADRRTLFVTSAGTLKFVSLAVPGLPD